MKSRTLLAVLVGGAVLIAGAVGAWTSASQGAGGGVGSGSDDPAAVLFEIAIDGATIALFPELELSSGIAPADLELVVKGGETQLKLPAKRTPPTVTLKRGMTRSLEIVAWHELAQLDNAAARKSAALIAYNAAGTPVARWNLTNAWPAKLQLNTQGTGSAQVLMETVTLVSERIQRVSP